jgi:hypothetical protein
LFGAKAQGEIPRRGKKAERGSADGIRVTPPCRERTCQVHESRSYAVLFGASSLAEGAGRGESRGGYWEGEASESLNPTDGFGMK